MVPLARMCPPSLEEREAGTFRNLTWLRVAQGRRHCQVRGDGLGAGGWARQTRTPAFSPLSVNGVCSIPGMMHFNKSSSQQDNGIQWRWSSCLSLRGAK